MLRDHFRLVNQTTFSGSGVCLARMYGVTICLYIKHAAVDPILIILVFVSYSFIK
jgi:hypothetical protein